MSEGDVKFNGMDLEPKACDWAIANGKAPLETTFAASSAISLKRIADALEKLSTQQDDA